MKYIIPLLLLSACSASNMKQAIYNDVASNVLSKASDSDVGYGSARCRGVQAKCTHGQYDEWLDSDGRLGCSCNV
ncbi:hypothetical protein AB4298_10145 [Shewanella sp. 10N.261.52.F9]|uniref:hypothetical protein n=1 Tax=Shewanella TaxID=22 RepID=UPI002010B551|nr:hypothetical protein [Shewanella marinintestina]MCL1145631.1 hypothetical protein [Shewanella marinintestina]